MIPVPTSTTRIYDDDDGVACYAQFKHVPLPTVKHATGSATTTGKCPQCRRTQCFPLCMNAGKNNVQRDLDSLKMLVPEFDHCLILFSLVPAKRRKRERDRLHVKLGRIGLFSARATYRGHTGLYVDRGLVNTIRGARLLQRPPAHAIGLQVSWYQRLLLASDVGEHYTIMLSDQREEFAKEFPTELSEEFTDDWTDPAPAL
jgi:hypothetical protein